MIFLILLLVGVISIILVVFFVYAFQKLERSVKKIIPLTSFSFSLEDSGIHVSQYGTENLIGYNQILAITDTTILGKYGSRTLAVYCDNKALNFSISDSISLKPNYLQIRQTIIEKAYLLPISSPPLCSIWAKNKDVPSLKSLQIKGWLLFVVEFVLPAIVVIVILFIKSISK